MGRKKILKVIILCDVHCRYFFAGANLLEIIRILIYLMIICSHHIVLIKMLIFKGFGVTLRSSMEGASMMSKLIFVGDPRGSEYGK